MPTATLVSPSRRLVPRSVRGPLVVAVGVLALFCDLAIGGLHVAELTLAAGISGAALLLAAARPGAAIGAIMLYVPLQQTVLAWMYAKGVPTTLVRDLGYVKDVLVGGVCLAAFTNIKSRRVALRLDALDVLVLLFVAIATVYLALPTLSPGSLGAQSFSVRIDAWRLDCLFLVLFLAARRTPLQPTSLRRIRNVVFFVAFVMFATAVWESVDKVAYNRFLVDTIHLPAYQAQILHVPPPLNNNYIITSVIGGLRIVRVGGLLVDQIGLGFYMVMPFALALERISGSRSHRVTVLVAAASGVTIALTETRSAAIAACIAIALGTWLAFRVGAEARLRLAAVSVVALLIAIPAASHTAFSSRFASAFAGSSNADNQIHQQRSESALKLVLHHPAGQGLGANPATGLRNDTSNAVTSENSYLQVGTELGVHSMIVFVLMYLVLLFTLRARSKIRDEAGGMAGGAWLAGAGLFVAGFFLHVWTSIPVSLTYWGLAGVALAGSPAAARAAHSHVQSVARPRGLVRS
ncbi:MAG TPA: O-antigen ligase family protein [Mycobacteriales bacterium]|nr:O-antigen ligase family protein [Mycobacteriales bacterium]